MVHIFPEIIKKDLNRSKYIWNFYITQVFVISLARFIVVTHNTSPILDKSKPILEIVMTPGHSSRYFPNNHLNKNILGENKPLT